MIESDSEDDLPPGWEERVSDANEVYFAHSGKEITQWTHPRTGQRKRIPDRLPFGWTRQINSKDHSSIEYIDHIHSRKTIRDPRLAFALEDSSFRQRFDGSSDVNSILHGLDLSDKIAVVTGGNSGIGFETVKALASHGCTVLIASRNQKRAKEAIVKIKGQNVEFYPLDLSSFHSVRHFASRLKDKFFKIDILILNAGIFARSYHLTEDGFEQTYQVNYLSHFYLCQLLRPLLSRGVNPKIVAVSSESHRFGNDTYMNSKSNFFSIDAYNNSKFCLTSAAYEMDLKWKTSYRIRVLVVHPGNLIPTNLYNSSLFLRTLCLLTSPFCKSLTQGASCSVYAAVAPEMSGIGGLYINNCFPCLPHSGIFDLEARSNLWSRSLTQCCHTNTKYILENV